MPELNTSDPSVHAEGWMSNPPIIDTGPRWPGETTVTKMLTVIDDDELAKKVIGDFTLTTDFHSDGWCDLLLNIYRAAVRERIKVGM